MHLPEDSTDITDLTLFVKYLDSGDNNEVAFMTDGENLVVEESFIYGNTQITAGETVASLIDQDASKQDLLFQLLMVYFSFVDILLMYLLIKLYLIHTQMYQTIELVFLFKKK